MRFSENRLIAWIVFALAVLLSVSLSGGKAMNNMRFETQQIFYDGAQKDGLSINRDLDVRAERAYVLVSIARSYLPQDSKVLTDAESAISELTESKQIPDRYTANVHLTRAVEDLYTAIEGQPLSESDKTSAYSAYKEIKSRADTISRDMYNSEARKFNESIAKFPASVISGFTGVEPLTLFE